MDKKPYREGFTLIELALSMVFVAILALAIALVIRDTIASYRRGLTLNQINTVGMDMVDDMRAAVQNSQSKSVLNDCLKYYYSNNDGGEEGGAYNSCKDDQGYNFVYWVKEEEVTLNTKPIGTMPVYGAFCTGTYSYIWNSGYFETEGAEFASKSSGQWAKLRYMQNVAGGDNIEKRIANTLRNDDTTKPFRLLKVRDDRRGVCAGVVRNKNGAGGTFSTDYVGMSGILPSEFEGWFDMTDYTPVEEKEPPVDIIMTDKTYDLALYDLFVARPAISSTQKNMFYSVSFILGTVDGGINILEQGKSCSTPSEYTTENYDYCSINKFSFAAQSGAIE